MANPFTTLINKIKTTNPKISLNKNANNNAIEILNGPQIIYINDDLLNLQLIIDQYNKPINHSNNDVLFSVDNTQYTRGNVLEYLPIINKKTTNSRGGKSKTKTRKTNKRKKTNKRRKTKSKTNKRKKRTRRRR